MRHYGLNILLICLAMGWITGCSGRDYDGDERAAFSGTVTLNGEPVPTGTVYLMPSSGGADAARISGATIQEGAFRVEESKGPNLGTYKISFELTRPTGKYRGVDDSGTPYDPIYQNLTPKSLSRDQSQETVDIESGENIFKLEVTSDGKLTINREEA